MNGSPGKARTFIHRWRSSVFNSSKHPSARLDPTARLVCLALSEYANADGRDCFPATDSVARLAGLNDKAARQALIRAADAGWLIRTERCGHGQRWRRIGYELVMPEGADPTPARSTEKGEVIEPARPAARSGLSRRKVRALTPKGAGAKPDELEELTGRATWNSNPVLSDGSEAATWKTALAMLTKSGLQEARARAVIGKARKILKNDDAILRELVGIAERDRIAEPGAWLLAAATTRTKTPRAARPPIARATAAEAEASADAALTRLGVIPNA